MQEGDYDGFDSEDGDDEGDEGDDDGSAERDGLHDGWCTVNVDWKGGGSALACILRGRRSDSGIAAIENIRACKVAVRPWEERHA